MQGNTAQPTGNMLMRYQVRYLGSERDEANQGRGKRHWSPECSCQGLGVECSDSCRGGWWGTGCLGAHGGGRPVLLNHLSQPLDEAEVSPNGEEALCSGAEENLFIPLPKPEFRVRALGLEGSSEWCL